MEKKDSQGQKPIASNQKVKKPKWKYVQKIYFSEKFRPMPTIPENEPKTKDHTSNSNEH